MTKVEITKIPLLNSVVIKQTGGHAFIAAKDSFIIDKAGFLKLVKELIKVDFIEYMDLEDIVEDLYYGKDDNENKENSSNPS